MHARLGTIATVDHPRNLNVSVLEFFGGSFHQCFLFLSFFGSYGSFGSFGTRVFLVNEVISALFFIACCRLRLYFEIFLVI